ncbi:MAG: 50S ribosomal protein L15 [Treponema sp.]|nr:50S ribosomal protein L15 [Treponema sp.]
MSDYNPVLHAPSGANKKPKRVGRGSSSGHGSTAGRGNKGQQSRSGKRLPYVGFEGGQMPLYRRIARRGFSNMRFKDDVAYFNISELEAKFSDGDTVDRTTLVEKKLLSSKNGAAIKVLGNGDITKKLVIKVDKISKSAKEKIEKAGGSVDAVAGVSRKERNAAYAKARDEKKAKAEKKNEEKKK